MSRIIAFTVGVLAFLSSNGQTSCNLTELSKQEKALLKDFCTTFKEAINSKNKQKIAGLCKFPFSCSHCIVDSTKESDAPYIKVTKKAFNTSQYKIFFQQNLVQSINNNDLFEILHNEDGEKGKGCAYFFGYPIVKPSGTWEGLQGFFTIKKTGKKYKITSAWTVP